MVYPFPAYQNLVLAVRPMITCFSLLTLLLCCGVGGGKRVSSGSPAPQLTDLRSQITGVEELLEEFRRQLKQQQEPEQKEEEGWQSTYRHRQIYGDRKAAPQAQAGTEEEAAAIQQQLQEVGVRPAGDLGEDLCNFNQLRHYIIRTKDSLEAGATFLKAPPEVKSWKQCLEACCSQPSCSTAVVERSGRGLNCFLFDCTHRGRSVCQYSSHRDYSSYTLTGRNSTSGWAGLSPLRTLTTHQEIDKQPISNAGQDVVLQLPVNWVILDGRESSDDHAIIHYDWTLLRGDPLVDIKVPQPGTLKLSHLQEGVYTLQLTVTDSSGQKSSDNVSVRVLPAERHGSACTGVCTRYQFICDDGCCIDITLACDRVVQCPDGSDEAFCQNFSSGRKTVIHITGKTESHSDAGRVPNTEMNSAVEEAGKQFMSMNSVKNRTDSQEYDDNSMLNSGTVSSNTGKDAEKNFFISKDTQQGNGHPVPETGAVLPLALGLTITSLLLSMVVCRLKLVRQKLKKSRPLTSEESDYLINGMYL